MDISFQEFKVKLMAEYEKAQLEVFVPSNNIDEYEEAGRVVDMCDEIVWHLWECGLIEDEDDEKLFKRYRDIQF